MRTSEGGRYKGKRNPRAQPGVAVPQERGKPKSGPSELGPYKGGLEYGDLGDEVECVKAAAELPHSKGDGVSFDGPANGK